MDARTTRYVGFAAGLVALVVGFLLVARALIQLPFYGVEDDPVGPAAPWLAGIGLILIGIFTVSRFLSLPAYSVAGMALIVGGMMIVPTFLLPAAIGLIAVGMVIMYRALRR